MRKVAVFIFLYTFLLSSFFISTPLAKAQTGSATLFLSPSSGTYTVNKNFTVKVMVNSGGGIGINASEGVLSYDPAYLSVSKLSDTSSIFKLWTQDPTFSNASGKISFGGGSPSAYKGNTGEIFNITFTAKKVGTTNVAFTSGIVLAADGKGTNVFGGFGNASYTIVKADEKEDTKPKAEEKEEVKGILPPLPEVFSQTHPKDDIWYSNNEPEFNWKVLSDLTGISFDINDKPAADPGPENDGIVEAYTFDPLLDGELYFHIKYQNRFGWGQIAHRRVLIDATPPEPFDIFLDNGGDATNPTPKLVFSTIDKTSGISHYEINIDANNIKVNPDEIALGYYRTQPLPPGEYIVDIAAVDNAQNTASSSIRFIVDPLKAPIITSIPKVINRKEELIVRGTSFYPRVIVKLFIAKKDGDPIVANVSTDDEGNWSYFHRDLLEKGNYEVWAKIVDARGAQSLDSTKHLLTVVSPSIIETYGWFIILFLLLIIAVLVMYILYQNKEFTEEKNRIMVETREVKNKLGKIFSALREEVDELIELADKKTGLSDAERRIKEKLQESLDISEEFISKEVEDIEKEIKLKKKEEK